MRAHGALAVVLGLAAIAGQTAQTQTNGSERDPLTGGAVSESRIEAGKDARTELRVEKKPIPPPVIYEFSRTVGPGRLAKKADGRPGELIRTYRVLFEGSKPVSKELLDESRIEPEPVLFWMGRTGFNASRHSFSRGTVLTMHATAYDPSAGRGKRATFRTATGRRAEFGIAAVDPRAIPLGTHLFIEGYGLALAADVGRAIKGNRIDLCYPTYREAKQFGRRSVRVHVLK